MDVKAICLSSRLAILTDDTVVPVTNLLDLAGQDVAEPNEAVAFVAGSGSTWFAGDLSDYDRVTLH